ncbi:MAG: LapA family protein [Paracoccaceae bacterium]
MRYLRYSFIAIVGLGLLVAALANRSVVTLRVIPEEFSDYIGWAPAYELPLFVVIFGGVVAGLLIGFVWEWFREHKHRAEAQRSKRDVQRLQREMKGLKTRANSGKDEVLALLDDAAGSR